MDCRSFQKQHIYYLDDTLPGDVMAAAQRHIMSCDRCAAHDTMVRRSLMMVRNLPSIEPSDAFRERLRVRLAECREPVVLAPRATWRSPFLLAAAVASVAVMGALTWQGAAPIEPAVIALSPVLVTEPATPAEDPMPYLSSAQVQAMATGNPVWPAALMAVEDAPSQYVNTELTAVRAMR